MTRTIFEIKFSLSITILIVLILFAGCAGVQRSNLTVAMPESVETSLGKQEVLNIELLPLEADANDIVISLSVPPEISFVDSKTKEFKTLARDQKIIIPFNYSARSDGTFNLTIEIKASNANIIKRNFTVDAYVSAPKWEIGEFWIYNQTKGEALGLQVAEVIGKDVIDGKEYYVSKGTWEGAPNGTYALKYLSVDTLSSKKTEHYENNSLLKNRTTEVDPPLNNYGFPLKVGKKWSWNGFITGAGLVGKYEAEYEVVKKESITVPIGTYNAYVIKQKMTYTVVNATGVGTIVAEKWYVPELNGEVKEHSSVNVLGKITSEAGAELLEHGKPPAKPRQIQKD